MHSGINNRLNSLHFQIFKYIQWKKKYINEMASGITLTKVRRLYVFSSLKYCTWSQHMYSCSMQFWNNSFQLMKTMVRMDRDPTSSPARHPNTCTHTHTHTPHTNVHTPAHIHTQNAHVHPPTHTKTPIRTHTYTPPTTKAYPHAHDAHPHPTSGPKTCAHMSASTMFEEICPSARAIHVQGYYSKHVHDSYTYINAF